MESVRSADFNRTRGIADSIQGGSQMTKQEEVVR
jgi:hypothetical protein